MHINRSQMHTKHEELTEEMKKMSGTNNIDFEFFKKHNLDLKIKERKKAIPKAEEEKEEMIDEATMSKLEELIKQDQGTSYKTFENKEEFHPIEEEEKNVLVHRPLKNFVWGLGQQTKQKKFKFVKGELPTVESMVSFLESNNLRDIVVVPTHKLGLKHLKEHSILASGFTTRQIYKVAKQLTIDLKSLEIPDLPFVPMVFGRRDEEWVIVDIGQISIHFMVDTFRKEMDLLDIWLNPVEQDFIDWNRRVEDLYYGKKK